MNWQLRQMNTAIKKHDRDLFVNESHTGMVQIFRKKGKQKQYVMSLTEDWSANSEPVPWGTLPVLQRLKMIDVWNNEALFEEMEKQRQKDEKSKEREFDNQTESFLYEFRDQFKKTFNDVNTANMDKTKHLRMKERKRKWE